MPGRGPAQPTPRAVGSLVHSGLMTVSPTPSPLPRRVRCTFVPPYLLRHLTAEDHQSFAGGDQASRHTLRIDAEFRERREQVSV
jgi:hypothetical protein